MQREPDYGFRLTEAEYDRQIVDLYRGLPPMPAKAQLHDLQRRELDLRINHRLGQDFPAERRAALWAAQQRLDRTWLRPFLVHLLRAVAPGVAARTTRSVARSTVNEYSKVLSRSELARFFDLGEGEIASLPLDKEQP